MFLQPRYPLASALLTLLVFSGCAADDHAPAHQTSVIPPQPAERSEPAGTAFVAALDALALGCEAFGPPSDRHSQPPTDDEFRRVARETDGNSGGR